LKALDARRTLPETQDGAMPPLRVPGSYIYGLVAIAVPKEEIEK
jgi:hypothetical protein